MTFFRQALLISMAVVMVPVSPAQEKESAPEGPESVIKEALGQGEGATIEEAIEAQLREKYSEAQKLLKRAESMNERAGSLRASIETAPAETEALTAELESLPSPTTVGELPTTKDVNELRKLVDRGRAALADLESDYATLDTELSKLRGRPLEASIRLTEVRTEVTEVNGKLVVFPSDLKTPAKVSERALLQARLKALSVELEMLKQERLSQVSRERLLQAKRDLALRKRSLARSRQAALEELLNEAFSVEVELAEDRVEAFEERVDPDDPLQQKFTEDLDLLFGYYAKTSAELELTSEEYRTLNEKLALLSRTYVKVQDQVAVGAYDGALAQVLLEQRRTLPNPRVLSYSIEARQELLGRIRRVSLQIEDMRREGRELAIAHGGATEPILRDLLEERKRLTEGVRRNVRILIQQLSILDADERAYRDLVIEFRDFLIDKLFWRRSSPPVDGSWIQDIQSGVGWVFLPEFWRAGRASVTGIPQRHPWWMILLILIVGALVGSRRRLIKLLKASGDKTRRISTDRYGHTLKALLYTHLISLPIPLLIGFIGWGVVRDPVGSDWLRGVGNGLIWSAVIVGIVSFFRNACRRGGLCDVHFGWGRSEARNFSKLLLLMFLVEIPAMMILSSTLYEDSAHPFNGLGRLCFMVSHLWMSLLFAIYLNPSKGLFSRRGDGGRRRLMVRFRYVWYPLLVLIPLCLVVMAGVGYVTTSASLSFAFLTSLAIALGGALLHAMILRWFMIKERRLALREALTERQSRKSGDELGGEREVSEEEVRAEEATMDLDAIGFQTRRLLRSISIVGVVLLIWWQWSLTLPVSSALDRANVTEGFSFLVLIQSLFILGIGTVIIKNLPGLIELSGLRDTAMDSGTRWAVATIAQYAVSVVVALSIFKLLDLNWSQFGWIAAALSVGLGFGLQEVVANFVCGIILLFERPIRVGDVVVVNDISGTVTRIRMRATTITNWDREDLVVPNKDFITGSLVNCTLSNKINRFVAKVGVAYGSDVGKALTILDEIAHSHPLVMSDPAPVTTFEGFGDSTLELSLRCYLANRDNRLGVITGVHREIDRRFREAGLEIAFPQRDLHLRSVDPAAQSALKESES